MHFFKTGCFSVVVGFFIYCASVQFSCSVVSDSMTPWTAARQTSLSFTNSQSLLKLMSIESVMPSNHLILCHPLLLLPSIFPRIRVLSKESVLHIRWPKYWSFSFSIRPSNEYLGLISFGKDWFDLLDTTLISIDTTLSKMLPSWLKDCPLLAQAGLLKYRCPPGENLH